MTERIFDEYDKWMQENVPEPEPHLFKLPTWIINYENDGEWTGPGDDPPGSDGDWYETERIVDAETGRLIADAVDVETAREIVAAHNSYHQLSEAIRWIYARYMRSRFCPACGTEKGWDSVGFCTGHMTQIHTDDCPFPTALETIGQIRDGNRP